jgi:hypothetical protein
MPTEKPGLECEPCMDQFFYFFIIPALPVGPACKVAQRSHVQEENIRGLSAKIKMPRVRF